MRIVVELLIALPAGVLIAAGLLKADGDKLGWWPRHRRRKRP